ncbi:MAG: 2-hydroxyacyl-CoA dehydratase [Chloroflexi bacterium]|nr:2-hydroxyacyl-CoA dehydratase [Chloroflexota bacterium]
MTRGDNARQRAQLLAEFHTDVQKSLAGVRERKARDRRKAVGCVGLWVPEELIHAVGMLPVVIPPNTAPSTGGNPSLAPFFCAYVRGLEDMAQRGELDFFAGLVMEVCCNAYKAANWALEKNAPGLGPLVIMALPMALEKPGAKRYVLDELRDFLAAVEGIAGQRASEADLRASIRLYNRRRSLLKKLCDYRRARPSVLSARQTVEIVLSGMLIPREEYCDRLEALLATLEDRAPSVGEDDSSRVRVILSGSLCEHPEFDLLDLIDELGAAVVDDDLYAGSRYFATPVDESETVHPLEALADAYVNMQVPCPTRYRSRNWGWGDYLVEMAHKARAEGVINITCKFCEPHDVLYPFVRARLERAGIPEMHVESAHEAMASGQVRTRLQAFVEILQSRRGL